MFWSVDTRKKDVVLKLVQLEIYHLVSYLHIQNSHRHKETACITLLSKVAFERKVWPTLFTHSSLNILAHSIKIDFIFPDDDMILKKKRKKNPTF